MKIYPKIGIRPTIDARQGGVRESLEEKTMNLAKLFALLISSNLRNGMVACGMRHCRLHHWSRRRKCCLRS